MEKKESEISFNNLENYLTYNQLNKDYCVKVITLEQYQSLSESQKKETHLAIMIKRSGSKNPQKPPVWFKSYMEAFKNEIYQRFDSVEHRLDNVIKKNNLKE